jgi:hypothetical protein
MYAVLIRSLASSAAGIRLRWQKLRRVGGLDNLLDPAVVSIPAPPRQAPLPHAQ